MLLRGWVSAGSYIQVYWETGAQCYADRIAYPWLSSSSCLVISTSEEAPGSATSKNLSGATPSKFSEHGRALAVSKFEHHLRTDQDLNEALWQLSGARLVCHCRPGEECHADVIRTVFREQFPDAHDRDEVNAKPPAAQVLNYVAKLREVPEQSVGSSADEGAPEREEQVGLATVRQWKFASATSYESSAMANPWRLQGGGHQSSAGTHSTNSGKQWSSSSRTSQTRTAQRSC